MKFCINCGNKLEDNMRFCPSCGYDSAKNQVSSVKNATEESLTEEEYRVKEESVNSQHPEKTPAEEKPIAVEPIKKETNAQQGKETQRKKKSSGKKIAIIVAAVFAALVLAVILPTVIKGNKDKEDKPTYMAADSYSNAPETTEVARISVDDCLTAYEAYLNNYINENKDSIDNEGAFSLIYIDDDDIPELVIGAQHYHVAGAELCIYDGNKVKSLGNHGQFGLLVYFPKKNIFFNNYSGMGGITTSVYNLENYAEKEICSFKEEPLDITSEEFRYYIDDKEVSYSEYQQSYSKIVPDDPVNTPNLDEPDSYPLTEEGIRKCFKSSEESTTRSGRESFTAKENSFNSKGNTLAFLADMGYASKAVELLGEDYTIDYFYNGTYSHQSTGNFAEERMIFYPDSDEYGTIGLIIYRFGDDNSEKVNDNDFINGVMYKGKSAVAVETDLKSDITYGELKERFGATAEKDSNTGIYNVTVEYRGNDISFAFDDLPSDSDTAYECWLQPHI